MSPVVKNILAVVVGLVVGGIVNAGIIMLSQYIIPLPEGVNPMDAESIAANIDKYETKHFILPLVAHALGTLVGAFIAAKMAANRKMLFSMVIGTLFLIGGILAAVSIPAPTWFKTLDLLGAYFPMAFLGGALAGADRIEPH